MGDPHGDIENLVHPYLCAESKVFIHFSENIVVADALFYQPLHFFTFQQLP